MNIKSITFDCPVFNGNKIALVEEVHAPEINYYVNSIAFNREHCYLITVEFNNEQYVIDNNAKKINQRDNVLSSKLNSLSRALNAAVRYIEVTFSEESGTYKFNTLRNISPHINHLAKELIAEYPNLLLSTNTILMEYSAYMNTKQPPYAEKREYILVTIDHNDTTFVISRHKCIRSANNYLHKVAIKSSDVNFVKVTINEDNLFSVVTNKV